MEPMGDKRYGPIAHLITAIDQLTEAKYTFTNREIVELIAAAHGMHHDCYLAMVEIDARPLPGIPSPEWVRCLAEKGSAPSPPIRETVAGKPVPPIPEYVACCAGSTLVPTLIEWTIFHRSSEFGRSGGREPRGSWMSWAPQAHIPRRGDLLRIPCSWLHDVDQGTDNPIHAWIDSLEWVSFSDGSLSHVSIYLDTEDPRVRTGTVYGRSP